MRCPPGTKLKDVSVTIGSERISVSVGANSVMEGALFQAVDVEESEWELKGGADDGKERLLKITLVKKVR